MKNCINLTTAEVQMIFAGATMIARPFKEQPHAGLRETVFHASGLEDGHGRAVNPNYQPGQTIYGREEWSLLSMLHPVMHMKYHYRADGEMKLMKRERWHAPVTMPREAARIFLHIESVEVKRCQDVTMEEAVNMVEKGDFETDPFSGREYCWFKSYNPDEPLTANPRDAFFNYYISRYGFESWEANEWCWLYTVTRVEKMPEQAPNPA